MGVRGHVDEVEGFRLGPRRPSPGTYRVWVASVVSPDADPGAAMSVLTRPGQSAASVIT